VAAGFGNGARNISPLAEKRRPALIGPFADAERFENLL
jgi:hypothetical protein